MSKPDANGSSRLHIALEQRRQTGIIPSDLRSAPRLPPQLQHVWDWFVDLSKGRQSGMYVNPIGWSDMRGYFALAQVVPLQWELRILRRLDDEFIASRSSDKQVAMSARDIPQLKDVKDG